MELWIRSQDKRILQKVDNIFLDANYENKRISTYNGDNTELGTYKTKERAIEILDEIQNIMRNYACVIKTNRLGEEIDLIPKPILIYNMPKK
jgi:hypothetical protein